MNKILVTGGAGFLGSHLCHRLLKEGNAIICVDNFFTGTERNLVNLLSNPHFEVIRHDVSLPLSVEVDQIYNLACPASPVHYQADPIQTTKTSVLGALNMLELAKRLGMPVCLTGLGPWELKACNEAFLTGSLREITPLVRVGDAVIGDGRPGPVTRKLIAAYRKLVERECPGFRFPKRV